MKVYAVWACNREGYEGGENWLINFFTTQKSAEEYIQNIQEHYEKGMARLEELDNLECRRALTEVEERECKELMDRWFDYPDDGQPECWIRECEVQE